jgi:hypothetical protein
MMTTLDLGRQLEEYTMRHPHEMLLVTATIDGKADQIAIFKGFSSSLMCPTAFDPDVPVIPVGAEIHEIDRLQSPYNPNDPRYIERHLTWAQFREYLVGAAV